uniref:Uncharacterized protein n=2 Tax=Ursus TaxID=9639 RepID=A0A452V1C4_URSMA
MDRSSRKKMIKKTSALNDMLEQMDLTDIFYPKATEYTFLSNSHGTFSRIDQLMNMQAAAIVVEVVTATAEELVEVSMEASTIVMDIEEIIILKGLTGRAT